MKDHRQSVVLATKYSNAVPGTDPNVARYKQLTCPEEIKIAERGDECAVQFLWLLADHPEPATLVDACFAGIVAIGGRGTGRTVHPKRVEFQRFGSSPRNIRILFPMHRKVQYAPQRPCV
jgi:hypothetical protein